jgi:hypothetical protein
MSEFRVSINVKLVLAVYEVNGQERFHVHLPNPDGTHEDVTESYNLIAAVDPGTGQRGFTLMKKSPTQQEPK